MPRPPLPARALDVLRRPSPAVMATVRKDGSPVTAATWYLWEDDPSTEGAGQVLVNLDGSRVRLAHLRRDPHVSLTVLDPGSWYSHVTLIGRVVRMRDDDDLADIDRIARHYTGEPYGVRDQPRVSAFVEVDRWTAWGAVTGD